MDCNLNIMDDYPLTNALRGFFEDNGLKENCYPVAAWMGCMWAEFICINDKSVANKLFNSPDYEDIIKYREHQTVRFEVEESVKANGNYDAYADISVYENFAASYVTAGRGTQLLFNNAHHLLGSNHEYAGNVTVNTLSTMVNTGKNTQNGFYLAINLIGEFDDYAGDLILFNNSIISELVRTSKNSNLLLAGI